jgi:hypothetical protein
MAVGIRAKLPGVTQEQWDAMDRQIDSEPPPGLIFHASGPIEGGWGVLDFWESRELFDRFIAERVAPVMAASGASPPDIRQFPVYEYLRP